jgi:arylsulfatase A-like enzyme
MHDPPKKLHGRTPPAPDPRPKATGVRRRALAAAAAVAAAALAAVAVRALLPGTPPRPNVLVLVMDTTRGDRCSVDGYPRPTTTCLDQFAKDAVVFRDAWSPANWTVPAHASLFTGLRAEHHGLYEGNRRYLSEGSATLAELLGAAGYATACFTNNSAVSSGFGLTQGFERVEELYARQGRVYPWARETHELAAAWAEDCAKAGRPFFLFVNDMEPHLPYTPPAEFATRFVRRIASREEIQFAESFGYPHTLAYDLRQEELSDEQLGLLSDLYDGEIATLDSEIGRLLGRLHDDGLLDSTLVVVLGDHGEDIGDHHLFEHALGLHRSLLHVPLVVRYPGRFDKGRVVDDLVRVEDVFPTVLETCGLGVPAGLDGAPLGRDLPGRVALSFQMPQVRELSEYAAAHGPVDISQLVRGIRSAYDGTHHLIAYSDGKEELFDVRSDPHELHDLRAASPDVASRLRALMPPLPAVDGTPEPK